MEKLYNLSKVFELASGDRVFVKKLLGVFITQARETLELMQNAHINQDLETIGKGSRNDR